MKLTVKKNIAEAKTLVRLSGDSLATKAKALKEAAANKPSQKRMVNMVLKSGKDAESNGKKSILRKQIEETVPESDEDMTEDESDAQGDEEQSEDSDAEDVEVEDSDALDEESEEEDGDVLDEDDDEDDAQSEEEEDEEEEEDNSDADEEEKGSDDEEAEENPAAAMLRSMIEEDMIKCGRPTAGKYVILVENLPTMTENALKKIFSKYGKIVSVEFKTSIEFNASGLRVPMLNANVQFAAKECAIKACEMDGETVDENIIRVCFMWVSKDPDDLKRTVYVGKLKTTVLYNELYNLFERAGPLDHIRVNKFKRFAFVCFKNDVSVIEALKLDGEMLQEQPIRVKMWRNTNLRQNVVPQNRPTGRQGSWSQKPHGAKFGGAFRSNKNRQKGNMRNAGKKLGRNKKANGQKGNKGRNAGPKWGMKQKANYQHKEKNNIAGRQKIIFQRGGDE